MVFLSGYTHWTFHGELDTTPPISQPTSVLDTSPVIDDIRGLVRDALGVNSLDLKSEESSESRFEGDIDGDIEGYIEEESEEDIEEESDEDSKEDIGDKDIRYKKLLEECDKELYPRVSENLNNHVIFAILLDIKVILKRLYISEKTAKDMRWHNMGLTKDGKLRHPKDGLVWKAFDARYPKFASDPRSVRLSLASDGFNPFRTMSTSPFVHTGESLKDDPFIIASQARQVFYIEDPKDVGWWHIIMTKPRDTYDMGRNVNMNEDDDDEEELYTECMPYNLPIPDDFNETPSWRRTYIKIENEFLMRLKSYVRNKAQPEGSIAEGYIKEECLTFVARNFEGVETFMNRPRRNDVIIPTKEMYMLNSGGRKLGKVEIIELDGILFAQAHRYVLLNHPKIQPLRVHFYNEQQALRNEQMSLKTIEKLVNMRPSRGIKKYKYGFPLVTFSKPFVHTGESSKDDPFIIASQARQVFYIEDPKDVGWWHIIMIKPRDTYDMGRNVKIDEDNDDEEELYTECMPYNLPIPDDFNETPSWCRTYIEIENE
ncbi:RNA-directed DNA polymerase [Tanacetum coccineum]